MYVSNPFAYAALHPVAAVCSVHGLTASDFARPRFVSRAFQRNAMSAIRLREANALATMLQSATFGAWLDSI